MCEEQTGQGHGVCTRRRRAQRQASVVVGGEKGAEGGGNNRAARERVEDDNVRCGATFLELRRRGSGGISRGPIKILTWLKRVK